MKADLHIHTNFSKNGVSNPEEIVDAAIEKGLNYIAITDHNTIEGALKAREYSLGKNITVLIGEEIDTKEGKVIALDIERKIKEGLSLYETLRQIRNQNGYAIALRPYSVNGIGSLAYSMEFDAIEVFTSMNIASPKEEISKNLCKKYEIPMTASSGAYSSKDVGRSGIEFKGDIFESLISNDFKIFGKRITFLRAISLQFEILKSKIFSKSEKLSKIKEKVSDKKKSKRKKREERF